MQKSTGMHCTFSEGHVYSSNKDAFAEQGIQLTDHKRGRL